VAAAGAAGLDAVVAEMARLQSVCVQVVQSTLGAGTFPGFHAVNHVGVAGQASTVPELTSWLNLITGGGDIREADVDRSLRSMLSAALDAGAAFEAYNGYTTFDVRLYPAIVGPLVHDVAAGMRAGKLESRDGYENLIDDG
jgi:hypothetical protein